MPEFGCDYRGENPICYQCHTPIKLVREGHGKRAKTYDVCECFPLDQQREQAKAKPKVSAAGRKRKGSAEERNIVKAFEAHGWHAAKTAMSGAAGTINGDSAWTGDVIVKKGDVRLKVESKRHAKVSGLKSLLKLRDDADILWAREDHDEAYVVMPAKLFLELVRR